MLRRDNLSPEKPSVWQQLQVVIRKIIMSTYSSWDYEGQQSLCHCSPVTGEAGRWHSLEQATREIPYSLFFFFFLVWGSNQVYSFILMVILRIAGPCASWTYTLSLSYTLLPRKFCITLLSWPSFHTHFLCSSLETRWLKTHGSDAVACCESLLECPHTS